MILESDIQVHNLIIESHVLLLNNLLCFFTLACPVLYGNKWIMNKWVKWFANFKEYKCSINYKHFSIYQKHMLDAYGKNVLKESPYVTRNHYS